MLSNSLRRKSQYLWYLYRGTGVSGVFQHAVRKLIAPLYQCERQYVTLRHVQEQDPLSALHKARDGMGTACILVESPAVLGEMELEMPSATLEHTLRTRLQQGCIIFIACRPGKMGAGKTMVGYSACQRGVFSALGRTTRISSDVLFTHYTEVFPEYRGQRIQQLLLAVKEDYCRANKLQKICNVITIHNQPSLQNTLRAGYDIIGTVARVSVCRGLYVRETPWESIAAGLGDEVGQ
jgi:hypothetical protein